MAKQAQLFGVIGHPIGHSMSPDMMNAAFQALGLPHHYHAFDLSPENIEAALSGMRALGISGFNVTIPHKQAVLPYVDYIDPEAQAIGAVNTIVAAEDGTLRGYNTDGAGFVHSLQAEMNIRLEDEHALLIGAGGAAKGIGIYLLKMGCPHLTIVNRTQERAELLVQQLQNYVLDQGLRGTVQSVLWQDHFSARQDPYTLYIQTTSVGMWPNVTATAVTIEDLHPRIVVSDIVYNPLQTTFLKQAKQSGASIHPGLGMFIYQGALAFEYFTGQKAPVEVMRQAVLTKLNV